MPAVDTQGLVLRSVEVFETSKVLTLFTRGLGKVSALAKGARRLRSPFGAGLDLLSVCDIVLLHKASEALDLLTEATLVERFAPLHSDLNAFHAGLAISELLDELTEHHAPHPKLFDAAVVTLRHLGDPELRDRRMIRFELACLRELGHMPSLDSCVHCGEIVAPDAERVPFAVASGGVLCNRCRPAQPHVITLDRESRSALRALSAPGQEWREPWIAARVGPVRQAVSAVMTHLLGKRPKMLSYY